MNKDVNGLSRNPNFSELNSIGAYWHCKIDLKTIFGWHVIDSFLTFWQMVIKGYHVKVKWILQAFLKIQMWN
jgi:uncharacterized protein Usg